jgi:hypothetical protein
LRAQRAQGVSPGCSLEPEACSLPAMARRVLREGVGRDAVDEAVLARGLALVNVLPEGPGRPSQAIYATPGGGTFVHLVEDLRLGVAYLSITGDAAAALDARLAMALAVEEPGAHLPLLGEPLSAAGARRGLALLVIGGTGSDDEGVAAVERALASHDPDVRFAALVVTSYAQWERLLPLVDRIVADDVVPALRVAAVNVAAAMRASGASR